MRITGTESSSIILSQTKKFKKFQSDILPLVKQQYLVEYTHLDL